MWHQRARRAADRLLHHYVTEVTLLVLIVVSVALTVFEVVAPPAATRWVVLASEVLTGIFAVELLVRFWVARKKRRFFERYWIDILAVLPLIRPLRLFRVLRVLRLFRAGILFQRHASGFHGGIRTTGGELLALTVGTVTLMLLCAMVLLVAEAPHNPQLNDLEDVLWFSAYSLVAGEPIGGQPASYVGRWTTLILMLGGLSLFGVFVGTVSASMVTRLRGHLEVHELDIDELEGHVVVCGWNQSGGTVLTELFGPGTPRDRAVVLVTEVQIPVEDLPGHIPAERLYRTIGDYTRVQVLEAANVREAHSVILLADALVHRSNQDCDARTVLASLTIERLVPGIYTVAELHSRESEELLRLAGVEDVVVADFFAGMILGSVQRNRGLVKVLDDILTQSRGSAFHTHTVPERWAGRSVRELHDTLYVEHRAILVSLEANGEVVVNPPPDRVVKAGQRMVLLAGHDFRPL